MERPPGGGFRRVLGILVRSWTWAALLVAFLLVIPLTLWLAWVRRPGVIEPVILTVFCASFAWFAISILRWQRSVRRLGWKDPRGFLVGFDPAPDDPDDLEMWRRARQYCYSFAAVVLSMAAFAFVLWMRGE